MLVWLIDGYYRFERIDCMGGRCMICGYMEELPGRGWTGYLSGAFWRSYLLASLCFAILADWLLKGW